MIPRETPDYTKVCGHCELPIDGRSTQVNDIAFHPRCLEMMSEEMKREEEWKSMTTEEKEASYAHMTKRETFKNGGVPLR